MPVAGGGGCPEGVRTPSPSTCPKGPHFDNIKVKECSRLNWSLKINSDVCSRLNWSLKINSDVGDWVELLTKMDACF